MRHTVTRVHHDAGGAARRVKRKDGLDRDVHRGNIECLKHDLRHAFAVCLWVQGRLGQKHWVLFWCHTQLVIKSVVPNFLHVVPIGDDPMLYGVLQGKDATLALGLITHVAVLLVHANHDARHLRAADDRGKDRTRSIIASKSRFAHAAAVVHNQSCDFFISHGWKMKWPKPTTSAGVKTKCL